MQQAFLPRILDCGRYIGGSPTMTRLYRLVKDYEMDYNNTARLMELDGRVFRLSPGQIVFRRPGQTVDTAGPLDIYMLTLDYSHSVSPITNNFHLYSPPA